MPMKPTAMRIRPTKCTLNPLASQSVAKVRNPPIATMRMQPPKPMSIASEHGIALPGRSAPEYPSMAPPISGAAVFGTCGGAGGHFLVERAEGPAGPCAVLGGRVRDVQEDLVGVRPDLRHLGLDPHQHLLDLLALEPGDEIDPRRDQRGLGAQAHRQQRRHRVDLRLLVAEAPY